MYACFLQWKCSDDGIATVKTSIWSTWKVYLCCPVVWWQCRCDNTPWTNQGNTQPFSFSSICNLCIWYLTLWFKSPYCCQYSLSSDTRLMSAIPIAQPRIYHKALKSDSKSWVYYWLNRSSSKIMIKLAADATLRQHCWYIGDILHLIFDGLTASMRWMYGILAIFCSHAIYTFVVYFSSLTTCQIAWACWLFGHYH